LKTQSLALVAVLIVAVIAGGAYFSGAFGPSKSQSQSNSQTVDITIIGGVGVGTVDTFVPDNFTVTKGQNVTLVVQNTDDNTHGVEIPQFGVNSGIILPGDTIRLSFLANQTGVFRYQEPPGDCKGGFGGVCNSVQHMWGFITIVGP
jgi:heme/copper-type cytochrome/quinol oxidase subunit 2